MAFLSLLFGDTFFIGKAEAMKEGLSGLSKEEYEEREYKYGIVRTEGYPQTARYELRKITEA
jgi:hypothetical protein